MYEQAKPAHEGHAGLPTRGQEQLPSLSTCRTHLGICSAESEASWDESQASEVSRLLAFEIDLQGACLLVAPSPLFFILTPLALTLWAALRKCTQCFPVNPKLSPLHFRYAGIQSCVLPSSSVNPLGPSDRGTVGNLLH